MLGEALGFPMEGDDGVKNVLIGGGLLITSFLVFPLFILMGYYYRVLGVATRGESTPPAFDDWGGLLVDGLKMFAASLGYSIVAGIGMVLALMVGGLAGGASGSSGAVAIVAIVLGFAIYFGVAYLLPAAISNMAREDDIGAAFDFGTIRTAATSSDYFVAVVLAAVVGSVLGFVAGLLSLLLVGIFMAFYVNVAMYYLVGSGFRAAMESADSAGPAAQGAAGA